MALKNSKKVETNRYELEISIDAASFEKAVEKAYRQNVKSINVPGFRKGKAPRKMIEKMYGEGVFYEDALNILYPDAVEEAVNAAGLELVGDKIDTDITSIGAEGVEFKVTVTVKPEVTVGEYKGIKVEKAAIAVSDDEINAELNRLADRNARVVTAERAAENGDIAVIDFEGFVDGVAFAGGKGEGHDLTLGSGQFIPGFEEQIVGHVAGDEFDVNVTFPAEYHADELAGKAAVFKTKLNEVKFRELPAIDDEFAKDVSEFDTLDELKKSISEKILEGKTAQADSEVENALIEQIVEGMTVEVPDCMVEQRMDESVRDFETRLQYQGLDMKTYLQYMGVDAATFRENFRENALTQVKIRLALETIAKVENLEASEEELNAEYAKIAEMYKMEAEQIKAYIPAKELASDITAHKAIDLVKESAVVTTKKAAAKKPAAKKTTTTAAKKTTTTKKTTTAKKAEDGEEKKPAAKKPAAKKTTTAKKPAAKKAAEDKAAE